MRNPMLEHGWTPRAAGWFTRSLGQGHLGVVAIGVASKHEASGTATATAYVHFRDDELDRLGVRVPLLRRPISKPPSAIPLGGIPLLLVEQLK